MKIRDYSPFYYLAIVLIILILILCPSGNSEASYRIRGSLGIESYGYEDYKDNIQENHLWMLQSTRFSLYRTESKLSAHFSGGYIGDNFDDFSESGQGKFFKGYMQYGKLTDPIVIKLGRFYLHRGVGFGTIDGFDIQNKFSKNIQASVYTGLLSDKHHEFKFEKVDQALSMGAELKWFPGRLGTLTNNSLSLSYTNQNREGKLIRDRVGIAAYSRLTKNISILSITQFRLTESLLRKAILRTRYNSHKWNGLLEFGLMTSDISDNSWFADFGNDMSYRIKFSLNKYLSDNKFGVGLNSSLLMKDEMGFKVGPAIISPYGNVGYNFHAGEFGKSSGLWASLKYRPIKGAEIFLNASMMSYEWDAFDIESEDLRSMQLGGNYELCFLESLIVSAEFQSYVTPQKTSDRRMLGGLKWKFDSGRSGK